MRRIPPWRAVVLIAFAIVVFAALVVVLFWLAIAVALLLGMVWLNVVILPRWSRQLRVRRVVLELVLLVALLGGGAALAGSRGALTGGAVWLLGIGVPRLLGERLRRRFAARVSSVQRWEIPSSSITDDLPRPDRSRPRIPLR